MAHEVVPHTSSGISLSRAVVGDTSSGGPWSDRVVGDGTVATTGWTEIWRKASWWNYDDVWTGSRRFSPNVFHAYVSLIYTDYVT